MGCRAVRDKSGLVRLAPDGAGGVAVNPTQAIGRGAYVCPSPSCLENALRRKVLPRALRADLSRLDAEVLRERVAAERDRLRAADGGETRARS